MTTSALRKTTSTKIAAPLLGLGLALGATACSEESAEPNEATTLENLQEEEADGGGLGEGEADGGVVGGDENGGGEGLTEEDIAQAPNPGDFDDDSAAFFDDQQAFLQENVTVSGQVVEVFNPNAFVIGQGELATLVVTDPSVQITPEPGQVAQVTGDVATFVLVDVEAEYGFDFADQDFVQFETAPFIGATNVNLLDSEGDGGGVGNN